MRTVLILLGLTFAVPAVAQDVPWQYAAKNTVRPGEKAEIQLVAKKSFDRVEVALDRVDGGQKRVQDWTKKRWKAGKSKVFRWSVPAGKSQWAVTVMGRTGNQGQSVTVNLTVIAAGPLQVNVDRAQTDVDQGRITLNSTQPLKSVTVEGYDADGVMVVESEEAVDTPAGPVTISIDMPGPRVVKRLEIKAYDAAAQWVAIRIVSWYAEIPHDDVLFETARWAIRTEEAPKIDKVINLITDELNAFRRMLGNDQARLETLKLYVAGMTDRVGSEADNRVLSQKRAQAIAAYFKSKGIQAPVFYAGFGERNGAVKTADEIAEPLNRRAMYILSNAVPRQLGAANWRQAK